MSHEGKVPLEVRRERARAIDEQNTQAAKGPKQGNKRGAARPIE